MHTWDERPFDLFSVTAIKNGMDAFKPASSELLRLAWYTNRRKLRSELRLLM